MKEPDVLFYVTDYDARYVGIKSLARFYIIAGNKKNMRNAIPGESNVDSYTKTLFDTFLRGRLLHAACISFNNDNITEAENLIRDYRKDLEYSIQSIIDYLTDQYPDTLIVNAATRDIWLHGKAHQYIATDMYRPMFERLGFRDIDSRVIKGVSFPYLLSAYIPNLGGNGIIDNMEPWF